MSFFICCPAAAWIPSCSNAAVAATTTVTSPLKRALNRCEYAPSSYKKGEINSTYRGWPKPNETRTKKAISRGRFKLSFINYMASSCMGMLKDQSWNHQSSWMRMIQFITPNIQTVQKVQIPRNYCNKWTVLVLGSGLDLIRRDITQTKVAIKTKGLERIWF